MKFDYTDDEWGSLVESMTRPFSFAREGLRAIRVLDGEMRGTRSDGISYPWCLRVLGLDPFKVPYVYAAVRHDRMYTDHTVRREVVDALMRDGFIRQGMPAVIARIHHWAVRKFGLEYWNGRGHVL